MQFGVHAAQRYADNVAVVQLGAGTLGAQLQPEPVEQVEVLRPEAWRMRAQVEEDGVLPVQGG